MSFEVAVLADARRVEALAEALANVYRSAFCAPEYAETEADVERFAADQLPTHAQRQGFRLSLAQEAGKLVGFAYGYTGERGQWWTEHVAGLAPAHIVEKWVGGHFEFVELAVATRAQRRGVGQRLHDALLRDLHHDRALLTTYARDLPAPRLYRRSGWELLVDRLDERSSLYGLRLPYQGGPAQF